MEPLILASGSRYRAELLARLRIPFDGIAPEIDETPQAGESGRALTQRLALVKAGVLSARFPGRWVLGSDQTAECDGRLLGKPGTRERAIEQLHFLSGKAVEFLTAVALVNGTQRYEALDRTTVQFRALTSVEIEHYVDVEPAFDCAGSFKCEGYGIHLFECIRSEDPTGLIGLPLIAVHRLLVQAGLSPF
jgi:septum formation protein